MTRWLHGLAVCSAVIAFTESVSALDTNGVIGTWLASQTNLVTWKAEFVQTRALSTLTRPLTTRGRVWVVAPNLFRWELGDPVQTIAMRQPSEVFILYPNLKRAERYSLQSAAGSPWKDAMTLLDAGFPRNRSGLDAAFRIMALAETNEVFTLTLQPRSTSARKLMPELQLAFGAVDHLLRATQLRCADGTTLRNDFIGVLTNAPTDEALFRFDSGAGYKLIEPANAEKR